MTASPQAATAVAAQLRMDAYTKLYEAAVIVGDHAKADEHRRAAHDQLDVLLDARAGMIAGAKAGRA